MKTWLMGAISAVMTCAPVQAATIVQTSSNSSAIRGGFYSFDDTLGILTKVVFTVKSATHYLLSGEAPLATTDQTVSYEIKDTLSLTFYDYVSYGGNLLGVSVPLYGSGSFVVPAGGYGGVDAV